MLTSFSMPGSAFRICTENTDDEQPQARMRQANQSLRSLANHAAIAK
jgi:hypothetical protein